MGIPLHPMISGQPLRIKYLARAIAHMKEHQGVWVQRQRDRRRVSEYGVTSCDRLSCPASGGASSNPGPTN